MRPQDPQMVIVGHGAPAKLGQAVLRLVGPLGQVHVHHCLPLGGQGKGAPDKGFRAGKGGMEADQARDQVVPRQAGVVELGVLAQAQFAVIVADPLGRLEGQHAAQPPAAHHLGLDLQRAGQGIGRFQAVVKGGHAGADHLQAGPVGGGRDQLVAELVLDEGPPELLQEGPESGRRPVQGDAVGQHAVHVVVGVGKGGGDDTVAGVDDLRLGIARAQLAVRAGVQDLPPGDGQAVARLGRLGRVGPEGMSENQNGLIVG